MNERSLDVEYKTIFYPWLDQLEKLGVPDCGKYIITEDGQVILFANTDDSDEQHTHFSKLPSGKRPKSAGFYMIAMVGITVNSKSQTLAEQYGEQATKAHPDTDPEIIARYVLEKCPNQEIEQMWSSWYRPNAGDSGGE